MTSYNLVLSTNESTVVAEYTKEKQRSDAYQSEAALEKAFIKMLTEQGYEYVQIHNSDALISNLRKQLEKLNNFKFSDKEWERFFKDNLANENDGIVEKTRKIQEDYIQTFKKDDGLSQNIKLIDKSNIHNNYLQVINQYVENDGTHPVRYDVTILVNGLPLVHVELKRRGVALKEAFNQIERYQRDSFWAGTGLYQYVQLFVISNGTNSKYYSNTTRWKHIKEIETKGRTKGRKSSNSFEFTSFWADSKNRIINDLVDFTKTFFAKHTILSILTRYCVFTADDELLVMRPYQITATEKILNRIIVSTNYKQTGTIKAGGYTWHTTGSGKTLTSFKTAQLACNIEGIEKVIFVVDRTDLDYQTMKEYDKFEKGAANGNKDTTVLQRQLEDKDEKGNPHHYKIIVTTIQKLAVFLKRNKTHDIYTKHIVMIFDECHRTQFGQMHTDIVKKFKNYHIFGFTGTPIFTENAGAAKFANLRTTAQAFGDQLHSYTIVDAINDGNVLPFRVDYINTIKKNGDDDKKVLAIDDKAALESDGRVSEIVKYTLEHFNQKTFRNSAYKVKGKNLLGFNSIFATSSIPMAKKYYLEFSKQIKESNCGLTVATIFSYAPNEEEAGGLLDDEGFDTADLDASSRDFLDRVIKEYNERFGTNFDSGSKFENYYKDLSQRVKDKEIDILIVVNMFLTGFDATTLNTLWVDKNLKQHGLIQAFSRTNRILNSIKAFGNIVCFRNLQDEVDEAVGLFGDKEAGGLILLKTYDEYYYGYTDEEGNHVAGYVDFVHTLLDKFNYDNLTEILKSEKKQKEFIALYNCILKARNVLSTFDEFADADFYEFENFMNYQSAYLDLRDSYKKEAKEKESILDDVVFEMEFIKQVDINIDYILDLVEKYKDSHQEDKEIILQINRAVDASPELRSKKALIEQFLKTINSQSVVGSDWEKFVAAQKEKEIGLIIQEHKLKDAETRKFIDNCFRDGAIKTIGSDIEKILPPVSLFGGGRTAIKETVIERLQEFFNKYFGL